MKIYCDTCEKDVETDGAWETVSVDVVDGKSLRGAVEIEITCVDCNMLLLSGDGWIDLYRD